MADSKVAVGFLFPLRSDLTVDDSMAKLPIYEGINIVGRTNLMVTDKRVSRKHISLHASDDGPTEVTVEGSNPVIFISKGERKKLCSQEKCLIIHSDIIELIPGHHLFKFVSNGNHCGSSSNSKPKLSDNGKRHAKDDPSPVKRNRQIIEDEIFARELQNEYAINSPQDMVSSVSEASGSKSEISKKDVEAISDFIVSRDRLPYIFRLMRVQGLPSWANSSSVAIDDVIQGNVLVAILSNYMVDIDWLMSACPILGKIPHVLIVHGESDGSAQQLKSCKPLNWMLHKPPLPIAYGTHHSKAMFLVYSTGVRVVVHTANLIHVDWNNKTQGLWMQDFPWKDESSGSNSNNRCFFENDLVDYLTTLKWPNFSVDLPATGKVNINPSFFRKFDYRSAKVRLIASVPGYHMGSNLRKWGHMKLRTILEECIFDKEFYRSPLVYQFSSLGSLDEKWLAEFASSLSSGMTSDKSPLGKGEPLIVWPTVEDVRCSIEGYRAGSCIPSPQKNVEKDFMKKYWAKWKANHTGRSRAMPHIKTYTRYNGQNLAWFLLTSANLSKAAWGALQKNNTQLMIRSYELGVLFLPSAIQKHGPLFSCTENNNLKQGEMSSNASINTKLATLLHNKNSNDESSEVIRLPVPYELPPQPYTSEDIPWSWDKRYTKKDVYGQTWP